MVNLIRGVKINNLHEYKQLSSNWYQFRTGLDVYFSERFSSDSVRVVVMILSCIVPRIILCFYFPALLQEVVFRPYHVYHEWPVLKLFK
jgi:hypothetical protein